MKLSEEEFKEKFEEAQEIFLKITAESPDVSMEKFYSLACFLENLSFFSPVLYSLLREKKDTVD